MSLRHALDNCPRWRLCLLSVKKQMVRGRKLLDKHPEYPSEVGNLFRETVAYIPPG